MEMLIVVAIMVILVAVAVPTFTSQVGKANEAADDANIRAAKAVAATTYLTAESFDADKEYTFNAATGTLDATKKAYDYGKDSGHKYIKVKITKDGEITVKWDNES